MYLKFYTVTVFMILLFFPLFDLENVYVSNDFVMVLNFEKSYTYTHVENSTF